MISNAELDEIRAQFLPLKTLPTSGSRSFKSKNYSSGAEVIVQDTGSAIQVLLKKSTQTMRLGMETYKGSNATANSRDRAITKAISSAEKVIYQYAKTIK